MPTQKFQRGDLVRIEKITEPWMEHFPSDCRAIVLYSYAQEYGGEDVKNYCLFLEGKGSCAWYEERQLTLIEANQEALLIIWKDELECRHKQQSNLDWIFENGSAVVKNPSGSSIQALADCLNFGSLWGQRGEGIDYYNNCHVILGNAAKFLESKDKEGWTKFCEEIKSR